MGSEMCIRDRTTPSGERRVACGVGFAAWMASTFAVFLLPTTVVDFRHVESADAVNEALARGGATARASTLHAGLAHAVVGALIAALTLSSAVRMTKSYLTATNIPEWAATYAGTSSTPLWRRFVLHTTFAAPLLTLVVSAPSMLAEPLRWSDQSARDAQSISFIIAGLCMFASMQPLTQAFLDGGLIAWYEVKEGTDRERLTDREHFIVSRKLDVTNHLVGKVLLQVAAPALLLLSCGIGAWSCGWTSASDASPISIVAAALFTNIGYFACAWSVITGAITIVMSQPLFTSR